MQKNLNEALALKDLLLTRQGILNQKPYDYKELGKLSREFTPYDSLWKMAQRVKYQIPIWMQSKLVDVPREELRTEVNDAYINLSRFEKSTFKNCP